MWKDEIKKQRIKTTGDAFSSRTDEQQLRMDALDFADSIIARIVTKLRTMLKDDTVGSTDNDIRELRQPLREIFLDRAGLN
tara:strand:- start:4636 stop:4878 length:243 start_codon:yes stop_codon:yes gene_type:complete